MKSNLLVIRLRLLLLSVALAAPFSASSVRGACISTPNGLVSWWPGNGNGSDTVGGNDATLLTGITFADGIVGQCFNFDGETGAIVIPASSNLTVESFTIETWIKPLDISTTPRPIAEYGNAGENSTFNFWYSIGPSITAVPGGLYALLRDETSANYLEISSSPGLLVSNQWSHVAFTFDSLRQTAAIYVNGVQVAAQNASGPVHPRTSVNLNLGYRPDGSADLFAGRRHLGGLDEPSFYNRALSATEIQAIYSVGSSGKCSGPSMPTIFFQPTNQTAMAGDTVFFNVEASGTPPLSFQWRFNGQAIDGQTLPVITLTNVLENQAGTYSVAVSNALGSVLSSNAELVVIPVPPCTPPSSGLVSWWRGENDIVDPIGANTGSMVGGSTFVPGKVGQAFSFDGVSDGVVVPPAPNLAVHQFTIEAWVKPLDVSIPRPIVEYGGPGAYEGPALWYSVNPGGAGPPGALYGVVRGLNPSDVVQLSSVAGLILPNKWSHVAFTFDPVAGTADLFVNGTNVASTTVSHSFQPNSTNFVNIGYRPERSAEAWAGRRHIGAIDEVSIYARALSIEEIQAVYSAGAGGKCTTPVPPGIDNEPTDQAATLGETAILSVGASGTQPLSYQWSVNGTVIEGATGASLVLNNVQWTNAGSYSVQVTNAAGSITSSNALLTVKFPPAGVVLGSNPVNTDGSLHLPIIMLANGNESALGFSLNFPPALLTYAGIEPGTDAGGASLFVNTNQLSGGRLGVIISLPAGATFNLGTQEIAQVNFMAAVITNGASAQIKFGDQPTARQLSDAQAHGLTAVFTGTTVNIPAAQFEGDVSPSPDGDHALGVTDWVLIGRYAARLDYPTNDSAFQRADCAPRNTTGDGAITVADWVQAGRYVAGIDPLTRAGGPTNDLGPGPLTVGSAKARGLQPRLTPKGLSPRQLNIGNTLFAPGQTGTVSVSLQAQGDENAFSFSFAFDPAVFAYSGAGLGVGDTDATIEINDTQAAAGRIGVVLALPIGKTFVAGSKEVVRINLTPSSSALGAYALALTDEPVVRQVVDTTAAPVMANYVNGNVLVNTLPTLNITQDGPNITLSWPLWATNFSLQQNEGDFSGPNWTNVPGAFYITNNAASFIVPASHTAQFYRLKR